MPAIIPPPGYTSFNSGTSLKSLGFSDPCQPKLHSLAFPFLGNLIHSQDRYAHGRGECLEIAEAAYGVAPAGSVLIGV